MCKIKLVLCFACAFLNGVCVLSSGDYEPLSYRLSTDVIPNHYSLKIQPYLDEEIFDGEVTIYVKAKSVVDKITLHSSELVISQVFINRIAAIFEHEDHEKLSVSFANDSIQPGEHVLQIRYQGIIHNGGLGFVNASFTFHNETGYVLVTDFEPTHARKAFPCFDEPAFKSKFNVRLVSPDDTYKAISNMQEISRFKTSYGTVYDFATSVPMSTYLVSFAITNYPYYEDILEDNGRRIPIRIHSYNASVTNNEFAMNCTKRAIHFYTDYTGISYPLSKLDMIEYDRPQSAATENWGLITFRQGLLSINLDIYDEIQIKTVVNHELAHFWFGNLVTNDWWNDLWLQEGFATYMSYKLYLNETTDIKKELRTYFFNAYHEVNPSIPTKPIVDYLPTPEHIELRFNTVVYEKGASVLLMLEDTIGEEAFRQVIREFLKRHAYKTATSNDFISTVEEIVPEMNVRDFLESYLYQNRFPLVNVYKSGGKFVLEQQVCATTANYSTAGGKWTFPVTYITDVNKTRTQRWFDKEMDNLTIDQPEARWILLDNENVGVYKTNFSTDLWDAFIAHFEELTLEESEAVIREAIYSFRFDLVDCDVLLNLMNVVKCNKLWSSFGEFHYSINIGLTCKGYHKEVEMYKEFLERRFNETNYIRKGAKFEPNCTFIENNDIKSEQKSAGIEKCAKWIRHHLSPNGNDISIIENK